MHALRDAIMQIQRAAPDALRTIADELEREANARIKRAQAATRQARKRQRIAAVIIDLARHLDTYAEDEALTIVADKYGKRPEQVRALLPNAKSKLREFRRDMRNRDIYLRARSGALNIEIAEEFDLSPAQVGRIIRAQFLAAAGSP